MMLAAAGAAQTAKVPGVPTATQLNPGSVTAGGGNYIVIGCISRAGQADAGNFVIADSRQTPPAQYRLQGDVDLLGVHVGHTVEIGGTITGGGATPTLTVKALTYISRTCTRLK
jgi:hypothetical protein